MYLSLNVSVYDFQTFRKLHAELLRVFNELFFFFTEPKQIKSLIKGLNYSMLAPHDPPAKRTALVSFPVIMWRVGTVFRSRSTQAVVDVTYLPFCNVQNFLLIFK